MFKKILITIAILVILVAVGTVIWYFFFNNQSISPGGNLGNLPGTGTTTIETTHPSELGSAAQIRSESLGPVSHFWVAGESVFTMNEEGSILKDNQPIGNRVAGETTKVRPNNTGEKSIFEFRIALTPQVSIFDATTNSWIPLPSGASSADWNPENENEVGYLKGGAGAGIYIFNITTKASRLVTPFAGSGLEIEWVLPNTMILSEKPGETTKTRVWTFTVKEKTIQEIINSLESIIGWTGNVGLVWEGGVVRLIDPTGSILSSLPFVTIPSKCAPDESGENIFCGRSNDFGDRLFVYNYLKRAVKSGDTLRKMVVPKNTHDTIREGFVIDPLFGQFDVWNPQIKNNRFYFINRLDDKLYSFSL